MLKLSSIETYYRNIQALRGISMEVEAKSVVTILGANGAGKSTTLRSISGLVPPARGEIFFQGQPIHKLSPEKIVRLGISHVPEGRDIFPDLTLQENLAMGAFTRRNRDEIRDNTEKVFRSFPVLEERKKQIAGTLSGGEQQMLAIARALMSNPTLILLDEPSLGLAPLLVEEIFRIIKRINQDGMTILLVEQNANMAIQAARYGYVFETGRIILHGQCEKLMKDDYVRNAYLGIGE